MLCLIGLAFAANVKVDLLNRLNKTEVELTKAIDLYTEHGFFYFVGILNETMHRIEFIQTGIKELPIDADEKKAEIFIEEVEDLEKIVPEQIHFPSSREIFKAGALYLDAIRSVTNHSDHFVPLKNDVLAIIKKENQIEATPKKYEKEFFERQLKKLYNALVNHIRDNSALLPEHFATIDIDAKKVIQHLKTVGDKTRLKQWQDALDRFTESTYHVAKLFPFNSEDKVKTFNMNAGLQYKEYLKLKYLLEHQEH